MERDDRTDPAIPGPDDIGDEPIFPEHVEHDDDGDKEHQDGIDRDRSRWLGVAFANRHS